MGRIWTRQPQIAVPSLSGGLVRADNFALLGRDSLGGPYWQSGVYMPATGGVSLIQSGAGGKQVPSTNLHIAITTGITVVLVSTQNANPSNSEFSYAAAESGIGDYNWGIYANGAGAYFFIRNTSAAAVNSGFVSRVNGRQDVLVGTYSAGGTVKLYRNGILASSNSQTGNIQQPALPLSSFLWNGASGNQSIPLALIYNRELSASAISSISANPWQIFTPPINSFPSVWVGAGSGAVTINCTVGDASAAGVTATITSTGSGVTITCTVGDAAAVGITSGINKTVVCTVGDASAVGVTANIVTSGPVTITCTVGDAAAVGVTAYLNKSIVASVGDAPAVGITAGVNKTVVATVGAAAAAGVTANILVPATVTCTVGDAVAAGVTCVISTTSDSQKIALILKLLENKQVLDATTGTFTVYNDDGITPLLSASAYEDAAGLIRYRGGALNRIDALQ